MTWRRFQVALEIATEASSLETLMRRYEDTPMSLADAYLVRISELHSDCQFAHAHGPMG